MKRINDVIYLTTKHSLFSTINSFFEENCLFLVEDFYDDKSILNSNNREDAAYDLICKKIEEIAPRILGVLISFNLDGKDCFSIAHHIRLHSFNEDEYNKIPIIITHNEKLSVSNPAYSGLNDFGLFKNKAAIFELMINIINEEDQITGSILLYDLIEKFNNSFHYSEYLENLRIPAPQTTTRHQVSNEWGALRLARNAGYSENEIGYQYPPTLYFKYLNKKYKNYEISTEERNSIVKFDYLDNYKLNLSPLLKQKKVLLIDDNADKGWKAVLSILFGTSLIEIVTYKMGLLNSNNELNKNLEVFDIIFLDLYLPEFQTKTPNKHNGELILKKIKDKFPHIPIIVFTASNKSWTLNEVLELGADGMYVKESPEYAGDKDYSKGNFTSFVKTISSTLDKYLILKPYWEGIQHIIKNPDFIALQEKGSSQFKKRIKERLEMFFGLLKSGFEQRKYNQDNFHFSDNELAFMTLWSVLNEISEAFFNKTQPPIFAFDKTGNKVLIHPNGRPITYMINPNGVNHFKWEILGQSDIFIEYVYNLKYDNLGNILLNASRNYYKLESEQYSSFEYNNNNFSVVSIKETKINFETTLYIQIAFLLEKKNNLSGSVNKTLWQQNLVALNELRNHLYLTHGSLLSTGFYNLIEKDKRALSGYNIKPEYAIKDLFQLIIFLITGKEVILTF